MNEKITVSSLDDSMHSEESTLIHIGFHKTGTSFLQKNVFEAFPEYFNRVKQRDIFDHFIYPGPLNYDEKKSYDFYKSCVKNNTITVFSNERLSGGPHTGGFDTVEIAQRLKACFPNGKIIIVIREQSSLIQSVYSQYIRAVGSCSLKEYLIPTTKKNKGLFDFAFFEFHRMINLYHQLFGRENVLVLPYELLKKDREEFLKRILIFSRTNDMENILEQVSSNVVNKSLSPLELKIKRRFNPFIIKSHPYLGNSLYNDFSVLLFKGIIYFLRQLNLETFEKKIKKQELESIKRIINNRYRSSNRYTQEMIRIDLTEHGYET